VKSPVRLQKKSKLWLDQSSKPIQRNSTLPKYLKVSASTEPSAPNAATSTGAILKLVILVETPTVTASTDLLEMDLARVKRSLLLRHGKVLKRVLPLLVFLVNQSRDTLLLPDGEMMLTTSLPVSSASSHTASLVSWTLPPILSSALSSVYVSMILTISELLVDTTPASL